MFILFYTEMENKTNTKKHDIFAEFENLLTENKFRFKTEDNIHRIRKAFDFSVKAHGNMKRQNGELYIKHCLNVAKIVTSDFGLGTTSVICALLHDIPTVTEYTLDDIKAHFEHKIYNIIDGLIKIKNAEYFENNSEASTFRQILISVSDDLRVIFIKIADKLDNIRTIDVLPPESKRKIVHEIANIYAPIAHRIGLYNVKDEMEDICLRENNPFIYKKISAQIQSSEQERLEFIDRFIASIKEKLDQRNIHYKIFGRPKTVHSIWRKMETKKVVFSEIYDLFAVRIIFTPKSKEEENFEALQIGSLITGFYSEKKERRRDWLRNPKKTGYRALHITVMSNEGQWVEVQIRSEEMHDAAEHGLAAHWKYKGLKEKKTEFDEKVKDLLNFLNEDKSSPTTFIDNLKVNLFNPEIYIFTPKGKIINLPNGSTVLDFAFKIHTDIGLHCIAGKVNGKTEGIHTVLRNGDQVEIITVQNQKPQRKWLDIVKTQGALHILKRIFREDIQRSIKRGEAHLEYLLNEQGINTIGKCVNVLYPKFDYKNKERFLEDLGDNKLQEAELKNAIKEHCKQEKQVRFWQIKLPFSGSDKKQASNKSELPDRFMLAGCCSPHPGDKIIGIQEFASEKILIHKTDCPAAVYNLNFRGNTIKVKWVSQTKISVLKQLLITGDDKPGMIYDITSIISKNISVKIKSFKYSVKKAKFTAQIELYIIQDNYYNNIITQLQKLRGVTNIETTN